MKKTQEELQDIATRACRLFDKVFKQDPLATKPVEELFPEEARAIFDPLTKKELAYVMNTVREHMEQVLKDAKEFPQ